MSADKPTLYVFAGPNGSGKSTVQPYFTGHIPPYNINADEIAKELLNGKGHRGLSAASPQQVARNGPPADQKQSPVSRTARDKKKRLVSVMLMKRRNVLIGLLLVVAAAVWGCCPGFLAPAEAAKPKVTFEWLIEPKYYDANDFREGVAWVQEEKDGPWSLIDMKGKKLVKDFDAEKVWPYGKNTNLAEFWTREKSAGFVNLQGDVAIPPQYRFVSRFIDGMAVVSRVVAGKRRDGVINSNGQIVIPLEYTAPHSRDRISKKIRCKITA